MAFIPAVITGVMSTVGGGSAALGAAITATAVGGGMQVYSTIQQGKMAEAEGKATAKIAEYNAKLQEREAKSRMEAAQYEEQKISRQQKIFGGQQRAAFAKSGVTLTGSSLDVLVDSAEQFNMDRLMTLRGGLLGKQEAQAQAGIMRAQGQQAKAFGKAAKRQSYFTAAGQGISTIGSIGMMKYMAGQNALKTGTDTQSTSLFSKPYSSSYKQSVGSMDFSSPYLPKY